MACYIYDITNNGNQTVTGQYKKCGSGQWSYFECPAGQGITFGCIQEGSIAPNDPAYYRTYVEEFKRPKQCTPPVAPPPECDLEIENVITTPTDRLTDPMGNNGTATINHIGTGEVEFSINGLVWQDSNYFEGLGAAFVKGESFSGFTKSTNYTAYVRKKTDHACKATKAFTITQGPQPLFASARMTKAPSFPGASDAEITVTVLSGSGNYTVTFDHDDIVHPMLGGIIVGTYVRSMDKTGLPAGLHTITVDDLTSGQQQVLEVEIADPVPAEPLEEFGDYFEIPFLNSIHFVDERLNEPQRPGNRLLENQVYPGIEKTCYFQLITKEDFRTTQFRTNFKNFIADLHEYPKGAKVKSFAPPVLREKNVGKSSDFVIRISNHDVVNQSRVSFPGGSPPIAIELDRPFEILNSEGFDGLYMPVTMNVDPNTGFEYIVINKAWPFNVEVPSITATGRFSTSTANFDIYECIHTFLDVPNGKYQIRMVAFDDNSQQERWSEPIDVQVDHPHASVLNYANVDNKFNMNFSHGYVGALRIKCVIGHKSFIGGEQVFNENADTSLTLVSAKAQRNWDMETFELPPWMNDKLALIMRLDYWTVNNVEYKAREGFGTPQYLFKNLLADTITRVFENKWMEDYNGDDLGTVAEGRGYVVGNNQGYIKR